MQPNIEPASLREAPQRARRYPASLVDRLSLADGRSVVVRPVLPHDDEAAQRFVRGLSAASRRSRFHVGIRELSPEALRAWTDVDHLDHVALVAQDVAADDANHADHEPRIVADARYVRVGTSRDAEFALAVADDWQRVGLGRALLERLARHARRHRFEALVGDVLRENARMIAMMRGMGARLARHPEDATVVRARFDLSA